jgi:UDPglucose 6-dehydrogenase
LEVAYVSEKLNKSIVCVITSTVNPGDCEIFLKSINLISKNKIELVYSPEFIALGSVMQDMLHPDIVLLGGSDDGINTIFSIYSRLYKSYPEYHRLSYVEAEIAKIAVNTYVTTKISFANMIGMFTEKMGGRANDVLKAIGGDSRIGRKYFKFGASYGGPCFPRDNVALSKHIESLGFRPEIPLATDLINHQIIDYWFNKITSSKPDAVLLNGLAYKSGTDFLEESFMVKLGLRLLDSDINVFYSDPLVLQHENFLCLNELILNNKNFSQILILLNYGDISEQLVNLEQVQVMNLWQ